LVKYKDSKEAVEVNVIRKATMNEVNSFDEKYVNLYGRTFIEDGNLCFDNPGTAIETIINGTSLTACFDVSATLYVVVEVDGVRTRRVKLTNDKEEYTLVSGLTDGLHTIRIINSSEARFGRIRLVSLSADEFYTVPEKANFRIEFIGDSITAGYGSLGKQGDVRSVDNSDACTTYAYLTARKLNVDYSMVAVSGISVAVKMWEHNYTMEEIYGYYSYT
jgi:hypothetical protein